MTISFIVPIFNGEEYIPSLIKMMEENVLSAKRQGVDCSAEAIFINDNPSNPIDADKYGSSIICIKMVSNDKNEGIHYTRAKGLSIAQGTYVCFLDQDDIISTQYLYSQMTNIGNGDAVLCNGKEKNRILYDDETMSLAIDINSMKKAINRIWSPGQVLIKRESIPDNWRKNIILNNGADDFYLWLTMSLTGKTIVKNQDILFHHRITGINTSNDLNSMRRSVEELAEYLKRDGLFSESEYSNFIQARNRLYEEESISALQASQAKKATYYDLIVEWERMYKKGIHIEEFFVREGLKKVAVYGAGFLGRQLIEALNNTMVKVEAVIDKRSIQDTMATIVVLKGVDAIIVTPFLEYKSIKETLSEFNYRTVSLCEVVYNLESLS